MCQHETLVNIMGFNLKVCAQKMLLLGAEHVNKVLYEFITAHKQRNAKYICDLYLMINGTRLQ